MSGSATIKNTSSIRFPSIWMHQGSQLCVFVFVCFVCCLIKVPLKVFVEPICWKWLLYTILFWRVGNNKFTKKNAHEDLHADSMCIFDYSGFLPGQLPAEKTTEVAHRKRQLTGEGQGRVPIIKDIYMNILQKLLSYQTNARTSCI